ncbi:hypothetical protein CPT_Minot_004 [Acinetobacter phage Minot]|nr:hypothetical protein CPT_Maestro_006 [Acinetobacter phage Maestro]QQM18498.1 hypothetical protein CPT_Morttis_005 [Acinetobacter phage Morttis]QQO96207.1 hypothetical protein CPT_Minot_004 [Acinetobacter phage Minot]QQO96456.1 hypothetical protein CPT_Mokit_005 [Acinetobacter phage Mokit]QQO96706.1 hypothetical protein CPT_Melin_005 [Acinetobacter phage Melin]
MKFSTLYEAVAKPKFKTRATVKEGGPIKDKSPIGSIGAYVIINGETLKATFWPGGEKNSKNDKLRRPDTLAIKLSGGSFGTSHKINPEAALKRAKLWICKDEHQYPVFDKDVAKAEETEAAWVALEKLVIKLVKDAVKTQEFIDEWNYTHESSKQILSDKIRARLEKETAAAKEAKKADVPTPKAPKQSKSQKNELEYFLNNILKSSGGKGTVSSVGDIASLRYDSNDFMLRNRLKAEIEDAGGHFVRGNTSTSYYEIDDLKISVNQGGITARRK